MTATDTTEREAFEAWALPKALPIDRTNGHYDWYDVRMRWEGWQARALAAEAKLAAQAAAVPDGRLHADGYFTWNKGKRPEYIADRGLPCDFYLAPVAAAQGGASHG